MGLVDVRDLMGCVLLRSWFVEDGSRTAVGMGTAVHVDQHGNVVRIVTEPTGLRAEVVA